MERCVKPFRLTITLQTPAVIQQDITLDAILAAALYRLDGDLDGAHSKIPLSRTDGVWHGSQVEFLDGEFHEIPFISRLARRDFDPSNYSGAANRKGKIRVFTGGGIYGAQLRKLRSFIGSIAFDGCGDVDQVRMLIESLSGIGKNVRQGMGRLRAEDIDIELLDSDQSLAIGGVPSRPVPVEVWESWHQTAAGQSTDLVGWKPPYWRDDHKALCVVRR